LHGHRPLWTDGRGRTVPDVSVLTLRGREVYRQLISGKSEKQIASELKISRHTVHVYVKQIYRRFDVTTKGELLSRCVDPKLILGLAS
jgi:DNA-binding CsgD family transcriptional regulator